VYKLHHDDDDYSGDHQQEGTTTLEDKIRETVYHQHFQFDFSWEEVQLTINRFGFFVVPLTVEFIPNNYSSLLQFHVTPGFNTGFHDDEPVEMGSFELGVPLTIAYF
jgi:hypothetical protein